MHIITPTDLKKFQIENYSEMLLKSQFEGQEKFLKNEIKKLQNERDINTDGNNSDNRICSPYRELSAAQRG